LGVLLIISVFIPYIKKTNLFSKKKKIHLSYGESIFIPQGAKYRIMNLSEKPMVFVEVQTGTYFWGDDIMSLDDEYKRTDN
jgi:mannose-6-phosphate isomerase-like protein (cupin superfamily)